MSGLYRDTGVVLRHYQLGEADRIVVLLTEEHGKVRGRRQGRTPHDLQVRGPAGADEPRAAAAVPGT